MSYSVMSCATWVLMHNYKTGGTSLREVGLRWVAQSDEGLYVEFHAVPLDAYRSANRSRLPLSRLICFALAAESF